MTNYSSSRVAAVVKNLKAIGKITALQSTAINTVLRAESGDDLNDQQFDNYSRALNALKRAVRAASPSNVLTSDQLEAFSIVEGYADRVAFA